MSLSGANAKLLQRRHIEYLGSTSLHALSERTARRHAYTTACGGKNRRRCATVARRTRHPNGSHLWKFKPGGTYTNLHREKCYDSSNKRQLQTKQILIVHKSEILVIVNESLATFLSRMFDRFNCKLTWLAPFCVWISIQEFQLI